MPDLFPTTDETEKDKALEAGIVNHLAPDSFKPDGLRPFFEYRPLGLEQLTGGKVGAHVIRAKPGTHADAPGLSCRVDDIHAGNLRFFAAVEREGRNDERLAMRPQDRTRTFVKPLRRCADRSSRGTSQISSNARPSASVTPSPAHNAPASPIASANPLPVSGCTSS